MLVQVRGKSVIRSSRSMDGSKKSTIVSGKCDITENRGTVLMRSSKKADWYFGKALKLTRKR